MLNMSVSFHSRAPDCARGVLVWRVRARAASPAHTRLTGILSRLSWAECPDAARVSAPQTQTRNQSVVTRLVLVLDVIQKAPALRHHLDQAAARVVILRVGLEMLGQVGDALGEHGHLNLGRSGIGFALG